MFEHLLTCFLRCKTYSLSLIIFFNQSYFIINVLNETLGIGMLYNFSLFCRQVFWFVCHYVVSIKNHVSKICHTILNAFLLTFVSNTFFSYNTQREIIACNLNNRGSHTKFNNEMFGLIIKSIINDWELIFFQKVEISTKHQYHAVHENIYIEFSSSILF